MSVIVKLPSGSWRAQVRRKGKYISDTFRRQRDAEEWALEAERDIDRGLVPRAVLRNAVRTFAVEPPASQASSARGRRICVALEARASRSAGLRRRRKPLCDPAFSPTSPRRFSDRMGSLKNIRPALKKSSAMTRNGIAGILRVSSAEDKTKLSVGNRIALHPFSEC
jgi:hypothetical protein